MSPGDMINHKRTLRVRFFLHHPLARTWRVSKLLTKLQSWRLRRGQNSAAILTLTSPPSSSSLASVNPDEDGREDTGPRVAAANIVAESCLVYRQQVSK